MRVWPKLLVVLFLTPLLRLSAQADAETSTPTPTAFPSTTPSPPPTDPLTTATPTNIPLLMIGDIALGEVVTAEFPENVYELGYTLQGQAGENIAITLSGPAIYGGCLRLESPEVYVTSSSIGVYDKAVINFFTLPSTDPYSVVVTQCGGIRDYTLKVEPVSLQTIGYEQLAEGTLTTSQSTVAYRFTGHQDELVAISLVSNQFDPLLDLSTLNASGGSVIISDDNRGGNLNAFIGPYKLPETGDYIITVRPSAAGVGAYRLVLNRLNPETIRYGDEIAVNLTERMPLQVFAFEAAEGDLFDIAIDSDNGLDTLLSLNDPNGNAALADDDSGDHFDPELIRQLVYLPGTHLIVVRPFAIGETGQVQLTLSRYESLSLDHEPQQVTLNSKVNLITMTFTGRANQRVRLTVQRLEAQLPAGSSPNLHVAQNSQALADASLQGGDSLSIEFVVPADEPVSVQLRDYGSIGGRYEVALERD